MNYWKFNWRLSLVLTILAVSPTLCKGQKANPATISVSGTAEIRVIPDYAVLTFSINSWATQLTASVSDNDEKVKSVMEFLKTSSISEKLIRTELIRIRPVFESKNGKANSAQQRANQVQRESPSLLTPIGYSAARRISITIEDLSSFEVVYRGLIERGVNEIAGLQFHTSELRKHRDEARLQAVRAAREKAMAMTSELGCTLSAVQSIVESGGSSGYQSNLYNSWAPAPGESSGGVAAGMIDVRATVAVVFILGEIEMEN